MFIGCLIKFTSNLAKNTDSEIQHLDSIILSIILRESYVLGMSLYGDVWRIYIRCEWSGGLHVVPQGLYSTCAATMTDVKYTLHITLFKHIFQCSYVVIDSFLVRKKMWNDKNEP